MNKLWGGAFVVLILCILWISTNHAPTDNRKTEVEYINSAASQMNSILSIGEQVSDGPLHVIVKWQGSWVKSLSSQEGAIKLSSALGLSAPVSTIVQDHEVYVAEGNNEGFDVKLSVTPQDAGELYVVLRFETDADVGNKVLPSIQTQYGETLANEGVEITWNAAIQTELQHGDELDDVKSPLEFSMATIHELEQIIGERIMLTPLEIYEDDTTASRTYTVSEFPVYALSKKDQVGMQIAVHTEFSTKVQQISIGSPVLTIEY